MVDLLVDTRTDLLELAARPGLKVRETMLEEDAPKEEGLRLAGVPM